MNKPILIAVEGIDGVGKSTQIKRLRGWFNDRGREVCTTFEPTNGQYGIQIRKAAARLAPALERSLFVQDRREHLETVIKPALKQGKVVITDRYFYSSAAYQGSRRDAFDHAPSDEELGALRDDITRENLAFAPEADILIFMRLDPDESMRRMRAGRDALDPFEARQTLCDVADAFERLVRTRPETVIVDASKSIDDVTAQIIRGVEKRLAQLG